MNLNLNIQADTLVQLRTKLVVALKDLGVAQNPDGLEDLNAADVQPELPLSDPEEEEPDDLAATAIDAATDTGPVTTVKTKKKRGRPKRVTTKVTTKEGVTVTSEEVVTKADLTKAMETLTQEPDGMDICRNILKGNGYRRVSEIKEADYPTVLAQVNEAIGV